MTYVALGETWASIIGIGAPHNAEIGAAWPKRFSRDCANHSGRASYALAFARGNRS
jgi:hypothetical protein